MENENENKNNDWSVIDLILILGIIILSYNRLDGWGWLVFILLVRNW